MRLLDLEPEWLDRYDPVRHSMYRNNDVASPATYVVIRPGDEEYFPVASTTIDRAQGIQFLCPRCFLKNGGVVGTEHVVCWFRDRGVPDDALPGPGRWKVSGTGFADLTLDPSVDVDHGHWHGWIQAGDIKW